MRPTTSRFYAAAVPAAYAKYAKHNVYWLIDAGSVSPLRMTTINGAPAGAPLAVSHPSTVHHELDQGYLQIGTGAGRDGPLDFLGGRNGVGFCRRRDGEELHADACRGWSAAGELTLRMYSPYAMDHATAVSLNGVSLGSATWSGIGWTEARFTEVSLLGRRQHGFRQLRKRRGQDRL